MKLIRVSWMLAMSGLMSLVAARAHFPILVHDADLGSTNGSVTITYAVGHPFELEMEPAQRPDQLRLIDPRGRLTDDTGRLVKTLFRQQTHVTAWQLQFDPARGDTLVALTSPAEIDAAQKTLYREYVKVCIHRSTQGGWTNRTGQPLEIVPLTRPYGLRPGMVFSGRLMKGREPVANAEVYAERLNDVAPVSASMPPEPLVTYAAQTDLQGQFVLSLPDPGWWVVGAYADDLGSIRDKDKEYSHEAFAGFWVRVEPR
ncbi:MAG TPA: DUF4198 domain-containing protein [Candidatus Paceibacterota bacterium]|nr:DUF4198 domain-containing protein [Verrucomicrobiota bacterium]HRY50436.1 DUF4198 domain-containing protein [Candidatus Paceibacterota bacterium]HSA03850.1 DUF4198 domain-containing protein [Candidatus Paceibacterota bacterium]